jgi:hypothetical protein
MSIEKLFVPRYKRISDKMKAESKLKNVSKKGYYRIENNLGMALKPIKEESYRKQKNSIYYMNQLQERTAQI